MAESLDVSLHGVKRVEIIEQLVHICRYSPGLVLLNGEPGVTPISFLRHMSELLREELNFALLDSFHTSVELICEALISQWFVYEDESQVYTRTQRIHHFLDIGKEAGRMALIVVERAVALDDDAVTFLVDLMARHSRLTVLFSGVVEPRSLLRRTWQAEVPVHRIELPDGLPLSRNSIGSFEQPRIEVSAVVNAQAVFQEMKLHSGDTQSNTMSSREDFIRQNGDLFADTDFDSGLIASRRDSSERRIPVDSLHKKTGQQEREYEPALGVSMRLADMRTWGAKTYAELRQRKSSFSLLIVSVCLLAVLLLLTALYYPHVGAVNRGDIASGVDVQSTARGEYSASTSVVSSNQSAAILPPPVIANPVEQKVQSPVVTAPPSGVDHGQMQSVSAPIAGASVVDIREVSPSISGKGREKLESSGVNSAVKASSAKSANTKKLAQVEMKWRGHPENFTVQLAATRNASAVNALAARLPKDQPHFVYQSKKEGKPWFVLVYGSFASRDAATRSRNQLAITFKKEASPWVRKQGEIFGH